MNNVCFICNISKPEFTENGVSFTKHIKNTHYIWNYVSCIIGLLEKDPTEYNGVETYLAQKYSNKETDWLPFQMTAMLKNRSITEEEARDLRISRIEQKIDELRLSLQPKDN